MKFYILLSACLAVIHVVAGRGGEVRNTKEKQMQENSVTPSVRPEPAEETDDTSGAYQSDMILTSEQLEEVMELIEEQESGVYKRKATAYLSYRWPQNTVPYEFDSSSEPDRAAILQGMNLWTEQSCVQFVPYSTQVASALGHQNRIRFYKGSGCSSNVGMIGAGAQQVSIGNGCTQTGTVAHELGHTLGWHHEQSRPDRDGSVTINYGNLVPGKEINFAKYSASQIATHDVPYDTGSIMHYGGGYFSSNGQPTIVAHDPLDQLRMGNRDGFSFYDMKLANIMFGCSANCPTLPCQNEGYVGKECTCICKPGYTGSLCETSDPESEVGCIRELTESTGTLTSPGYPEQYGLSQTCGWKIKGGPGSTISLSFTHFGLENHPSCLYDKVIVRAGSDITSAGQAYCGDSLPPEVQSVGNQMLVIFSSDNYVTASGFQAHYVIHGNTAVTDAPAITHPTTATKRPATTAAPTTTRAAENCELVIGTCGGSFGGSGCIASPNYGIGNYNNGEECVYNVEVAPGQRVELNLLDLDVEYQGSCSWDRLEVDIGVGFTYPMRLCGTNRPTGSFVSMTNKMQIRLISDSSVNKHGFAAQYKAVSIN